ncbi:DNAJ protein JJJ1-like [Vitis vinifera]|uniref:DNAJ protein JJJ1-like n=1 Tax=Vitis vinifera TaxID=29760 RepID=A0A438JL03_VITVI|nr:DNAJ protein JJJ1-like [Vitis vinifera]
MASEGRCLYEVLGLTTDATADEIRSAYKKLALQRHPDKLVHSGLSKADATAQFQELLNAYEVLSNPRNALGTIPTDLKSSSLTPPLPTAPSPISSPSSPIPCILGLGSIKEAPMMGNLESPYSQVTAFYGYWIGFSTVMDFAWVDEYDVRAGPNRKSRRLMEEENRKLRKKAKREYNETVRGLAKFVKRRDKRVIDMQVKKSLEEEKRKEEEKTRKWEEFERGRLERARAKVEPEWVRAVEDDGNDDDWEFEDAGGGRKEEEEFYCVLCRKKFKSEKQWKNHEKSKKHKEWVAEFRESVKEEDERYGDAEAGIHGNGDQSEVELQEQFEDGLELEEEEIEDGAQIESSNEEEFVVGDVSHSGNGTNAELGSDDEMSVLEAMLSGHKNRKNGKTAVASVLEPESSVTEAPVDINNDEMDFMEYDNRKSSRRRRGKKDKGKRSNGEAMKPDSSTGDKGGQDEQNSGSDASHIQDSSTYSVAENETDGKEDHHAETNKIPKQPVNRKATSKGEIDTKPKESNKVRKAKAKGAPKAHGHPAAYAQGAILLPAEVRSAGREETTCGSFADAMRKARGLAGEAAERMLARGGLCQGDVGEGVGFLVTSMVFKKIGDECGGSVGFFVCGAEKEDTVHPMSKRSKAVGEGVAGFSAKVVAVGHDKRVTTVMGESGAIGPVAFVKDGGESQVCTKSKVGAASEKDEPLSGTLKAMRLARAGFFCRESARGGAMSHFLWIRYLLEHSWRRQIGLYGLLPFPWAVKEPSGMEMVARVEELGLPRDVEFKAWEGENIKSLPNGFVEFNNCLRMPIADAYYSSLYFHRDNLYLQLVSSALVPPVLISSNVFVIQVAQRKALGNTCETCGEDFESRWNKLHQHLGDTGHAMLRAR